LKSVIQMLHQLADGQDSYDWSFKRYFCAHHFCWHA
jgi:hypothetical protein